MRIGILDCSSPHWTAGEVYTRTLLAALAVADKPNGTELVFFRFNTAIVPPVGIQVCDLQATPSANSWINHQRSLDIDVVLPLLHCDLPPYKAAIGWIPDFQHIHLPQLFAPQEAEGRNRIYAEIAETCQKVILSSHAVARDFGRLYPRHKEKASVLSFPSLFAVETEVPSISDTRQKYGIPPCYALVPNQFWKHKNHILLPSALSLLKQRRMPITTVLTGALSDYRDPSNRVVSEFLQDAARYGVREDVIMLGAISRGELLDLLRTAVLVIQPSLSEGWNTTLQDAKALGVPIICSDLPVHREQCGVRAEYFNPYSAESLADTIAKCWPEMCNNTQSYIDREREPLAQARVELKAWGNGLVGIALAAGNTWSSPRSGAWPSRPRKRNTLGRITKRLKSAFAD
jgi:glycosyltransferase involved in cell wall biosynthesis